MANYAQVKNGVVVDIVLADQEWINAQETPSEWVEYTSEAPARIGGDYIDGLFYTPSPYPSWTRDEDGDWMPPTPYPTEVYHDWQWNEETLSWIAAQTQQ